MSLILNFYNKSFLVLFLNKFASFFFFHFFIFVSLFMRFLNNEKKKMHLSWREKIHLVYFFFFLVQFLYVVPLFTGSDGKIKCTYYEEKKCI